MSDYRAITISPADIIAASSRVQTTAAIPSWNARTLAKIRVQARDYFRRPSTRTSGITDADGADLTVLANHLDVADLYWVTEPMADLGLAPPRNSPMSDGPPWTGPPWPG